MSCKTRNCSNLKDLNEGYCQKCFAIRTRTPSAQEIKKEVKLTLPDVLAEPEIQLLLQKVMKPILIKLIQDERIHGRLSDSFTSATPATPIIDDVSRDTCESLAKLRDSIDNIKRKLVMEENTERETRNRVKKIEEAMLQQEEKIKELKNKIEASRKTTMTKENEITTLQSFVSSKYDQILKEQKTLQEKFKDNKVAQNNLRDIVKQTTKELQQTKRKTERNSQYSRWDCLEFHGVPEIRNENSKELVVNLCKAMHMMVTPSTISTAHRLRKNPRSTLPPAIIIKFNNRDVRNAVFDLKATAREPKQWKWNPLHIRRLYINESLTPEKKNLLHHTKNYVNALSFPAYVWSYKGNVYVRKDEHYSPRIEIRDLAHLEILMKNGNLMTDVKAPTPPNSIITIE